MAMKSRAASSVVMFDVVYEDGTRSSNRKVSASALGGLDGDAPARDIVERSLNIAADICIYTNRNLTIEEL